MVTVVGLRQISFAQLHSPTPKAPCFVKNRGRISYGKFSVKIPKFRYHANRSQSEPNLIGTVSYSFADPENYAIEPKITILFYPIYNRSYGKFSLKIFKFSVTMATGVCLC